MPLDARAAAGTMDLSRARPSHRAASRDVMRWAAAAMRDLEPIPVTSAEIAPASNGWTPQLVGEAMVEAMKWVRRTAPAGPRGMVTASLPVSVLSLDDFLEQGWGLPENADDDEPDERNLILPPTAKQVSRHMAALQWPADYLVPTHIGSARMVGLWALCKASRRSFAGAVKARGVHRTAAYALRDRGLSLIAQGLARDEVAVAL